MAPEKNLDPDPGGVKTPFIIVNPGPGGVFGPDPGGVKAGSTMTPAELMMINE